MDNYKRLITFILLAVVTQLLFVIIYGFYDLSLKKMEMNSLLTSVTTLVAEDGYLDTRKLDLYTVSVLEDEKFKLTSNDPTIAPTDILVVSISDSKLKSDKILSSDQLPQKGQLFEVGIHLRTEVFSTILPKFLSKQYVYDYTLVRRNVFLKWNKTKDVLFDYTTGGYLDSAKSKLDEYIDSSYDSTSIDTVLGKYSERLGD